MNSHTTHPLVDAWVRDLERLLGGIDPGERAEVLAGVHEHLDGSLAPDSGDDEVRRVLADLGSPQSVADEAYAQRPAAAPPSHRGPDAARPVMSRSWVPVVVGVLLSLALLVVVIVISGSSGYTSASTSGTVQVSSSGQEVGPVTTQIDYAGLGVFGALIALLAGILFWGPALVLTFLTPLWSGRQKTVLALLTPVAALALSGLPPLGLALTGSEAGLLTGTYTALALIVVGGGWVLVRLCRTATARTTEGVAA